MKKQLLSVMTLVAMAFATSTLVGCKDYKSDIDNLQTQITENKAAISVLQQAMSKGLMVNTVESVADGYKLTMSDGSVINLNHGKSAVAPKMRVNAAKNWEMSTDDGKTWAELKDAEGQSIADAKTFVKDYVKVNPEGYIVIGDKVTTFRYDVAVPTVTILEDMKLLVVTIAETENAPLQIAYVPMVGYFDQHSVTSVTPRDGKTTFTITKVELQTAATVGGVAYEAGAILYSSAGVPVVLNPTEINAEKIPFSFMASLADNELYELPVELRANAGTSETISTITKAGFSNAVWTINLASATSVKGLKGDASNLALCATNSNGTTTMSDYVYDIAIATGSTAAGVAAMPTTVDAYHGEGAGIKPAANIVASKLQITDIQGEGTYAIFYEDGVVGELEADEYLDYKGIFAVVAIPETRSLGDIEPTPNNPSETITVKYSCIGEDGAVAEKDITITFISNSPVQPTFVVEDAFVSTGLDNNDMTLDISKDDLLASVFGDNTVAKGDFVENGINFSVVPDAKASAGVKVEYYLDAAKVEAPVNVAAFNKIKITVPQSAMFAGETFNANNLFTLKFQLDQATPPTYFLGFNIAFVLESTSPVLASKFTGSAVEIPNTEEGAVIDLSDVTLYTDAEASSAVGVTGAVASFEMVVTGSDKVLLVTEQADPLVYRLTRFDLAAPDVDDVVSITITGTDAWGKEFVTEAFNVTIKAKV